jgi:chemotaxis protein MotB
VLKRSLPDDGLNPYIALSDLAINVVFILVFFVAAILTASQISREREQVRYKNAQGAVQDAVSQAALAVRPEILPPGLRNDPPGAQRWVFKGRDTRGKRMFLSSNPDDLRSSQLTDSGRSYLLKFAQVLRNSASRWRRIRIEGHTLAPKNNQKESWGLSARRAATVADLFANEGRIQPNKLAVAARGGQTPFNGTGGRADDPVNERVEIVIEYAEK